MCVIGCCVAVPRYHWSAVPTLLFIYISQLLRDSFSVSQQAPHLRTSFPLFHGRTPHLVPGRSVLQVAQLQERVQGGGGGGRLGHDGPAVVLIIIYAE